MKELNICIDIDGTITDDVPNEEPERMIDCLPYPDALENDINQSINKKDYLLCFGRLSPEKGIDILIKAAQKTGTRLKIAGSGPEGDKLKKLAGENNSLIDFLGFQENLELKRLIKEAEAVVIPSLSYDNMPLSLLEALYLRKIVLASRIGGIPEIIKNGLNGFLFSPGNINELVEIIDKLKKLNNDAILNLESSAHNSVKSYSLENNCQAVINLYRQVLKNNSL